MNPWVFRSDRQHKLRPLCCSPPVSFCPYFVVICSCWQQQELSHLSLCARDKHTQILVQSVDTKREKQRGEVGNKERIVYNKQVSCAWRVAFCPACWWYKAPTRLVFSSFECFNGEMRKLCWALLFTFSPLSLSFAISLLLPLGFDWFVDQCGRLGQGHITM